MRIKIAVLSCLAFALAACSSSGDGSPTTANPPVTSTPATTSSAPRTSSTPNSSTPAPTTSTGDSSSAAGPTGGPVPNGFTPTSATFVSADTGWVLGTAPCDHAPCTSIVRTRDGGSTWTGIPAPKATLGFPYSGREGDVSLLRFATPLDGWAGVGNLYSTHDGGATWHQQQVGSGYHVISAIETGGGYVYAVADNCPSEGSSNCSNTVRVYASPISKDDWQPVSATVDGGNTHLVVHGSDWFLPTADGVLHGHGADQASRLPGPCPSGSSASLAAADATHLDAVCVGEGAAGSARYQLYGSTDGGEHWTKAGPSRIEASDLSGVADNGQGVLVLSVASGGSYLLRTTDDGGRFTHAQVSAPGGGFSWNDLGFTTTTQGVVVLLQHSMYLTHDAGASWTPVRF